MHKNENSVIIYSPSKEDILKKICNHAVLGHHVFIHLFVYAFWNIIKKTLDGNAKMRINKKNVHKKIMHTIEKDKLFIR